MGKVEAFMGINVPMKQKNLEGGMVFKNLIDRHGES
jgi:hypothetical protein